MVEIGINLNENNQVIVAYDDPLNGDIRLEISQEVYDQIFIENKPFKYMDGELVVDTLKMGNDEKEKEILLLKQQLADTDYVVIKSMEFQLQGQSIPDEYSQIISDREAWRVRINILEAEIN